jgi:hypothetical protein
MIKTFRLLCCGLICFLNVSAYNPKDALLLQSGFIYPPDNVDEVISETTLPEEIVNGYYFRIIQFKDYPDENQKVEIKRSGIIINNYLPYRAYNCAIPENFDKSKLKQLKVRSVIKWLEEYKISKNLSGFNYPDYAINEKGKADLIVHYQKNISTESAIRYFEKSGFIVIRKLDLTHTCTLRIPQEKLKQLANLPFVYYIEPISPPSKKDDTEGRSLHRSNAINCEYTTGRHYDGNGVTIGLADDGLIGPHIDFQGRVTQHTTALGGSHGDMTSGICMGAGNLIQRIKGMATGSYLHVFDIANYPQIVDALANYNNYGIVITSTSYSQGCNEYTSDSEFGDQFIHDNAPIEFCFSGGNDGTADCSYGAGSGWGNITGGYKVGKNVIACGNLDATDILEASSSRGPAPDGRIKPDICSNGVDQRSTDEANTYQVGGGTSAACPGIAGILAQLYQAYKEINNSPNPPSALIKAILLNSAEDLGNPGPDYKFGWGRVNAFRAVTTLEDHRYFSDSIVQGQSKSYTISVPSGVNQLRIMLYWHDEGGNPAAAKNLVNDLDMEVANPANTIFNPWVLDPTPNAIALNSNAVRGVDSLNNVEQVTIDSASGGLYTITVQGSQVPLGTQKYFIAYEYRTDSVHVTFPNGGEGLVPNETELIRWDAQDTNGNFTIRYSRDSGANWNVISSTVPGSLRYISWNVPNIVSDSVLVEVSRNGFSDISDTEFTIIRSPANLHVTFACPDSIGLAWNAVNGATGYNISMLGNKYMDSIGTTNSTSFVVYNTNPLTDYWFSVLALGPSGGKGSRANAINQQPGLLNCSLTLDGSVNSILFPGSGLMTDCQNINSLPVNVALQNTGINSFGNFNINYSLNSGTTVTEPFTGTIAPGLISNYTFNQPLPPLMIGNYSLKTWLSLAGDLNAYNDTSSISINVIVGSTNTLSVNESFDSFGLCSTGSDCEQTVCQLGNGWINETNGIYDDVDWRVNKGATPSSGTGPDFDHTTGTTVGKYIYLEASGTCNGKTAILYSPCFDLNGISSSLLTFWYHMYGANSGEIHVDVISEVQVYNDIIPSITANHGNIWLKDSVLLNQFNGQKIVVRFRGITGNDYQSDIALDDIGVYSLSTGIQENSDDKLFKVFPNPGSGIFNYMANAPFGKKYTIVVEDLLGRRVYKNEMLNNTAGQNGTIDLKKEPKGVYTATFFTDTYSKQVKLININ